MWFNLALAGTKVWDPLCQSELILNSLPMQILHFLFLCQQLQCCFSEQFLRKPSEEGTVWRTKKNTVCLWRKKDFKGLETLLLDHSSTHLSKCNWCFIVLYCAAPVVVNLSSTRAFSTTLSSAAPNSILYLYYTIQAADVFVFVLQYTGRLLMYLQLHSVLICA